MENKHDLKPLHLFKQVLRKPFASGFYEVALYLTDGERICRDCCREEWREICRDSLNGYGQWQAGFANVYWEGPAQHCVQCNKEMPSEYGENFGGGLLVPFGAKRE